MENLDLATGQPLPPGAIQRVLYIISKVHVYAVPPLTSAKGYTAALWTTQPEIFTARLRIIETATPTTSSKQLPFAHASALFPQQDTVTVTILLEDPSSGALFAAAPYTQTSVIQHCLDSSRFFAIRVVGDGGRKATLGMGFEERSDAFDFGVTLQDASKTLGFDAQGQGQGSGSGRGRAAAPPLPKEPKRDYSLKDGETITVNIGGQGRPLKSSAPTGGNQNAALFSIAPPPSVGSASALPVLRPPPSAAEVRKGMQEHTSTTSGHGSSGPTAEELGFDDGEFGEFQ